MSDSQTVTHHLLLLPVRDHGRPDPLHHRAGQQDGAAEGSLRHGAGLVHHLLLPLLYGLAPGVRRSSLLHQGGQRRGLLHPPGGELPPRPAVGGGGDWEHEEPQYYQGYHSDISLQPRLQREGLLLLPGAAEQELPGPQQHGQSEEGE